MISETVVRVRIAAVGTEVQTLLDLEVERCRAISEPDLVALDRLLAADLTHTHVTGSTDDKPRYLAHLAAHPRTTARKSLDVRMYGDVAVLTGVLENRPAAVDGPSPVSLVSALQVWVLTGLGWRMTAFAGSRVLE